MATELTEELKAELLEVLLDGLAIDGGHHKQHELEKAVKLLTGCPKITKTATDHRGNPYSYEALGESEEFKELRRAQIDEEDIKYYREEGYTDEEISEINPWEEGIPG